MTQAERMANDLDSLKWNPIWSCCVTYADFMAYLDIERRALMQIISHIDKMQQTMKALKGER